MRSSILLSALCSTAAIVAATSYTPQDTSIVAHSGESVGVEQVQDGLTLYVSRPSNPRNTTTAILYLTDVFGIALLENRLLADSFARAGYLTVAPDLFDGAPAPTDINVPGFNTTTFLAAHQANTTDPKIAATIKYMREALGVTRIAATGYCYGGRYVFRFLKAGLGEEGVQAAFTAHPSLLEDGEIQAIGGPASVAAAETDSMMPPARRHVIEDLLLKTGQEYSISLHAGTQHGFGVRANVSNPRERFAKEQAFFQAVNFFDQWL